MTPPRPQRRPGVSRPRPRLNLFLWWRRASTMLPLALMLLLAGFSAWVAREALLAIHRAGQSAAAPQKPDYFLRDFQTRNFDDLGRSSAELSGAAMEHIPGNQTVRIAQPRLRVHDAQGAVTLASADVGLSNADGSNVQLFGQAELRREAPRSRTITVRSSFLNVFPQQRRISSNRPSTVRQGDSVFSGDDLQMNGLDGTFSMNGAVRGSLRQGAGS